MASTTLADVADVSALSAQDVYAVAGRRLLHWNGATWSSTTAPSPIAPHNFSRVYAAAADDIFVIGLLVNNLNSYNQVYRVHGGTWLDVTPENNVVWTAIDGRGANVWLSGYAVSGYNTRLEHWDGASFVYDSPMQTATDFQTVSVAGNGTVWVAEKYSGGGYVNRWQTGTWNQYVVLAHRVAATTGSDLFIFKAGAGASHSTNASALYPGNAATAIPNSFELDPVADANALPNYVMAVGASGGVLICDTTTPPGTCAASATGTTADLNGVAVIDEQHAFIVGDAGTILY